ncbi:MAG TPA: hypothetical protein VF590_16360, partial [Isosphaeraceae bacterium]
GGQSLTFRKRYQYVGTVQAQGGATLDKIAATTQGVTYAMDTTVEATAKVKASDLKIASSEGTILFDRKLGTVVESHGVDRITGSLTMTIGGKDLPSDLDLTLDIATVLKK